MYGKLGDVIGRRRMLLVALGINLCAYFLCATATSVTMLVFARILHGLGAGGLMTLAHALIGESVPPRTLTSRVQRSACRTESCLPSPSTTGSNPQGRPLP